MTYQIDTELLYQGTTPAGIIKNPEAPAIYPTTAYILDDMEDYAFADNGGRYYYNRTANPNRDELAQAISFLEKGERTMVCSSGMAAISTALLGLLDQGDHVLFNKAIYGETIELAQQILPRYGITADFADFTKPEDVELAVTSDTKVLYTEIIANPLTLVVDLDRISKIAKAHGALTVVDSTFTTPFVYRPMEHGADIVIHSLTKYFGGHSDTTGGSITGSEELIRRLMPQYLLLGCCLDPQTSWLILRSVKTMGMRVRAQNRNARILADALQNDPHVRAVYHPSLTDHPQHELATRVFDTKVGYGAMLSFRVEDDHEKVNRFMRACHLVKYLGTLGGIRTTFTHPATAFQSQFTEDELNAMGLYQGLIRISTGGEDPDDLIQDLTQALAHMDDQEA